MKRLLIHLRWAGLIPLFVSNVSCDSLTKQQTTETSAPTLTDYSSRRVVGRESIRIAEGVTLHADLLAKRPDGSTVAKGAVYLDGSRRADMEIFGWPAHGYAESADWNPATGTLTLKGWPVVESRGGHQQIALDANCLFVLENASFKALGGRTRTHIVTR